MTWQRSRIPVRHLRLVTKRWYVRFHDGAEWDAQPGEIVKLLATTCSPGQEAEAYIEFEARRRMGWFALASVHFHSDRIERIEAAP